MHMDFFIRLLNYTYFRTSLYTLLLMSLISPSLYGEEFSKCGYVSVPTKQNMLTEWELYGDCASYLNGSLKINSEQLTKIDFGPSGLAPFWAHKQMFYVKPSGKYLAVLSVDNGADDFREGLVRSLVDGKVAYFNKEFEQVIPPKYDWGWPFENGRALVCIGCVIDEPDKSGHRPLKGGLWGYINRSGTQVVPLQHSQEEVRNK